MFKKPVGEMLKIRDIHLRSSALFAKKIVSKYWDALSKMGIPFADIAKKYENRYKREIYKRYGKSKHEPHDGAQSCARRKKQLEDGKIFNSYRPWDKDGSIWYRPRSRMPKSTTRG